MNKKEILMYRGLILFLCLAIFGLAWSLADCYRNHNQKNEAANSSVATEACATFEVVKSTSQIVALPPHSEIGGVALIQALDKRMTVRSYSSEDLSDQQISDLLWSAVGVNREDGKRTSPTARNAQEINLYLFTKSAIYRYDAEENSLKLVKIGDFRAKTGRQPFFANASVAIAIVADFDAMDAKDFDAAGKEFYSATDGGYVSQNIYLYCAAADLATVACGNIERDSIVELLELPNAKAILSHPVGYAQN